MLVLHVLQLLGRLLLHLLHVLVLHVLQLLVRLLVHVLVLDVVLLLHQLHVLPRAGRQGEHEALTRVESFAGEGSAKPKPRRQQWVPGEGAAP